MYEDRSFATSSMRLAVNRDVEEFAGPDEGQADQAASPALAGSRDPVGEVVIIRRDPPNHLPRRRESDELCLRWASTTQERHRRPENLPVFLAGNLRCRAEAAYITPSTRSLARATHAP